MPSSLAEHWNLEPNRIFLNHGSFGACPEFVIKEQRKWQEQIESEAVRLFEDEMPSLLKKAREVLADCLSCSAEDVALVPNATTGVNTVLRSLVFNEDDEILVPDHA